MIDKDKTVWEFMRDHTCLVEDLRVAANLLPRRKCAALIHDLHRYADELAEYDHFLCKEWHNPFEKD